MDKLIQEKLILAIDDKVKEAGQILDLADLTEEESDNPDVYDTVYEERFHCGVCTVRTVMETVWPSVDEYLDYLEGLIRGYENSNKETHQVLTSLLPIVMSGSAFTSDQQHSFLRALAQINTPPEPVEREQVADNGL